MRIDDRLAQLITQCVREHGAEVIQLSVHGERGTALLQVFIDGVEPADKTVVHPGLEPVTIDTCSQVSRTLTSALAHEQLLPTRYRLEVSTPGVDRPLAYAWQYRKHKGRPLRITTGEGELTRTLEGVLAGSDEEGIELSMPDGTTTRVPYTAITKAIIRTPW